MTTKDASSPIFSVSKATALIAVFTFLSRIIGLVRDSILASTFGISHIMDAYSAAFRVPDLLFNVFIIGTLSVAFLPIFNREIVQDRERAAKLANTVFGVSIAFIAAASLILFIGAPILVKLVAPGFEGEQMALTIIFTRIMLLAPIMFTVSTVSSVLLQSHNKFWPTAVAPILYNLGIIFGATVLVGIFGPLGLPFGVVFGAFMHMLIQAGTLRKIGMSLKFAFDTRLESAKEVWRLYLPRLLFLDMGQVSLLVSSIVGSFLATGSIAAYYYANNLQAAPMGIFALSFAVACFPLLSRSWAAKQYPEFKALISKTIIQILFFILPLSALIFILRAQIVRVVLGHGRLDWVGTILTAQTLGVLALALFAQSLIPLLARAFYATYNTKIPVVIGLISGAVNVILAVVLSKPLGVIGIAAGTTIASILNFLLLTITLRIHIGRFGDHRLPESILKILIATAFASTATYATLYAVAPALDTTRTIGVFLQAAVAGIAGVGVYMAVGLLMNLKEAREALVSTKGYFKRI